MKKIILLMLIVLSGCSKSLPPGRTLKVGDCFDTSESPTLKVVNIGVYALQAKSSSLTEYRVQLDNPTIVKTDCFDLFEDLK